MDKQALQSILISTANDNINSMNSELDLMVQRLQDEMLDKPDVVFNAASTKQLSEITLRTTMQFTMDAIQKYHEWLTQNYTVTPK